MDNQQSISVAFHGCNDLVVSCIDYRFRKTVADWIKTELNDQADLISVAGTSKAFLDETSHNYILGLIKIAVDLHGVKRVHLLDHIDCGAYGGSKQHDCIENEEAFHAKQCSFAYEEIKKEFPELDVQSYIVTFDGIKQCSEVAIEAATAT